MAPPLLNLLFLLTIFVACSSGFNGFLTAIATFALVCLLSDVPRNRVSFISTTTVHHAELASRTSSRAHLPCAKSSKWDADASLGWLSDRPVGLLPPLPEEEDELRDTELPYRISVDDYVPISAMSLPVISDTAGPSGGVSIEGTGDDEHNLPDQDAQAGSQAVGAEAASSPSPLLQEQDSPITFSIPTSLAAGDWASEMLVRRGVISPVDLQRSEQGIPSQQGQRPSDASERPRSLPELSACLHRELREETIRGYLQGVRPRPRFRHSEAEEAQHAARQVQASLDENDLPHRGTDLSYASFISAPTLLAEPLDVAQSSGSVGSPADNEGNGSGSDTDLVQMPMAEVERRLDLQLSVSPWPANATDRISEVTTSDVSQAAYSPPPTRPSAQDDVTISRNGALAEPRRPFAPIVHVSRAIDGPASPVHRPWRFSGSTLQPTASRCPFSLVLKRSVSESHCLHMNPPRPEQRLRMSSAPGRRASTPPPDQTRSRGAPGTTLDRERRGRSHLSRTFFSMPRSELESNINMALTDDSFDTGLQMHGYRFGIAPNSLPLALRFPASGPSNSNRDMRTSDGTGRDFRQPISPTTVDSTSAGPAAPSPVPSSSSGNTTSTSSSGPNSGRSFATDSSGPPLLSDDSQRAAIQRAQNPHLYQVWRVDTTEVAERGRGSSRSTSTHTSSPLIDPDLDALICPASRESLIRHILAERSARVNGFGDSPTLPPSDRSDSADRRARFARSESLASNNSEEEGDPALNGYAAEADDGDDDDNDNDGAHPHSTGDAHIRPNGSHAASLAMATPSRSQPHLQDQEQGPSTSTA